MSGFCGSWPEQDAVDAWLKKYGIVVTFNAAMELKKATTKFRIVQQERADKAEAALSAPSDRNAIIDRCAKEAVEYAHRCEANQWKPGADAGYDIAGYIDALKKESPQEGTGPISGLASTPSNRLPAETECVVVPLSLLRDVRHELGEHMAYAESAAILERVDAAILAAPSAVPAQNAELVKRLLQDAEWFSVSPSHEEHVEFWETRDLLREAADALSAIRNECHDAAEQEYGCFRAVKAERELKEALSAQVPTNVQCPECEIIFDARWRELSGKAQVPAEKTP